MANRYWVNGDADNDWHNANNWSSTDGGAGGAGVPTSSDDVYFNSTSSNTNCTLSAAGECLSMDIDSSYTATLDFVTYNFHWYGDFYMGSAATGTRLSLGSGAHTCDGNWQTMNSYTTCIDGGTCVVEFTGTGKTYQNERNSNIFNVKISGSYTSVSSVSCAIRSLEIVSGGSFVVDASVQAGYVSSATLKIQTGGTLTINSNRYYSINNAGAGGFTVWDGTLTNNGTFLIYRSALPTFGGARDWGSGTTSFRVYNENKTLSLGSGTHTFGTLELLCINASGILTVNNSTNNPSFIVTGDLSVKSNGLGTITWTKGTGSITFSGTSSQSVGFNGETVEDIVVDKTAGVITMDDAITTDSFIGTSTGTGSFDPNGKAITTTGNCDWDADFVMNSAADTMNGCTWSIGGNWTANGQTLNATSTWYLQVTGSAIASGVGYVAYSDASGYSQIIATSGPWVDNNNNINWLFSSITTSYYIWLSSSISNKTIYGLKLNI